MSALILALVVASLPTAARSVTGVLAVCATLESVFGFCVGCVLYSFWTKIASPRSSIPKPG